jgi:phage tail sheath gpL-like
MTIAFNNIPGNLLVPFFFAEINSGGSPYEGQSRLLLIGQKLAAGTALANVPIGPVQDEREVDALAGSGSMLSAMFRMARRNANFQPIWLGPLADPAGAVATATLTITAPGVTGAGVIRVLGQRLTFQVNAADAANTVALAIRDAINAAGLGVSATAATNVVTVTTRHAGLLQNGLDLKVVTNEPNVMNSANCVVTALAGGSGVPSLTTLLANCGDDEFDWISSPYADASSLNAMRDFLSDSSGRWSPMQQLYGHHVTQSLGNLSTLVTLGNGRNDQHATIMGSQVNPTTPWEWAAALGGQVAAHLSDAPELSRPLQSLILDGVQPPDDRSTWWDTAERQALYTDGIAGYRVSRDGQVVIDRMVTTYQNTVAGVQDATFRDIETMAQLMFATRFFRSAVSNKHARQALADENPHNVAEITTPNDVRNTLIHAYRDLEAMGVVENSELFAQFVKVERDGNNATRLNAFLPVDVVNQLRVFAANVTAFLQYRTASGAAVI